MASDYVAPGPGGFVVVVGGQQIGTFPTQSAAEQAFNDVTGQSNAPAVNEPTYDTPNGKKTLTEMKAGLQGAGYNGPMDDASIIAAYNSTAAGTGKPTTTTSSAQNLLDAVASGDQARIDEATREFNMTFAENQRQYDSTNYTNLATSLLNSSVQLHGPKDYWDFQAFTSGGRDLMSQMFSNQPRPDFSAPTGPIEPETIDDLMQKLGFTTVPGASTSGTPGSYNTVNGPRTTDQMYQELHGLGWGGSATDTNAIVAAYASTTKSPVTPSTATPTTTAQPVHAQPVSTPPPAAVQPAPVAQPAPVVSPVTATMNAVGGTPRGDTPAAPTASVPGLTPNAATPAMGTPATQAPAPTASFATPISGAPRGDAETAGYQKAMVTGNPNTPGVPNVILPYQWNPAVFDALGPTGQALLQSTAEAQGWDWDEYLRQMNASRPQGTAPKTSTTSFSTPMGSFS